MRFKQGVDRTDHFRAQAIDYMTENAALPNLSHPGNNHRLANKKHKPV